MRDNKRRWLRWIAGSVGMLTAALLWGPQPSFTQSTTLLYEDWEGTMAEIRARWPAASFPSWPTFETGDEIVISTAHPFSGAQSLKFIYTGTQYDPDGSGSTPHGGGSAEQDYQDRTQHHIFLSWKSYMDFDFQTAGGVHATPPRNNLIGTATKGPYTYMFSPTAAQRNPTDFNGGVFGWVFHYFYGSHVLSMSAQGIKDAKPNGVTVVPYDTENFHQNIQPVWQEDGRWYCYIAEFQHNTPGLADGRYRLWVKDMTSGGPLILTADHPNREFLDATLDGRMPPDATWFRSKVYRQDGLGDMYYDDQVVSTVMPDCTGVPPPPSGGGTPPPPPPQDNNPPNAPTNLIVTWLWHVLDALRVLVSPSEAEAATASAEQIVFSWDRPPEASLELELTVSGFFLDQPVVIAPLIPGQAGTYLYRVPPLTPAQADATDRWVCGRARYRNAWGKFSLATDPACNQLAVGAGTPIPIPPPPEPEPVPPPDHVRVSEVGDVVTIECDPAVYRSMKTTGRGLKRTVTCLK